MANPLAIGAVIRKHCYHQDRQECGPLTKLVSATANFQPSLQPGQSLVYDPIIQVSIPPDSGIKVILHGADSWHEQKPYYQEQRGS